MPANVKSVRTSNCENWDTFGLRGSGSNQVIADNVYVPMERILRLTAADETGRPPEVYYDKDYPLYHVPFIQPFTLVFQIWH